MTLPTIKNYSSRKEWEAACWRKVLKSEELLNLLITPNEKRDLAIRAGVMEGLLVGKSYSQIGEELWASSQTISGIKKALSEKGYKSYQERSKTERKKRKYSPLPYLNRKPPRPEGKPRRTKYGTIYFPTNLY